MKKLLILFTLTLSLTVNASHILGGIIQVAQTSPDSTSIGLYIVSESFPPMPQSISVQKWAMNSQGWYDLDGYVTLDKVTTSTHQGFNTAMYVSDYLNLDSNKYRFIYTNCCLPMLNNSSNSMNSDVVISADYWHVPNNTTPFMEQPLWINVQSNAVNSMKPVWGTYNCHFINPDGDSVNLHLTELYASYSNGVFVPQVQSSTNVLANNDSITFVGTKLGSVGYGFQIDKYRNGYLMTTQRIQWTFKVVNSTVDIEELEVNHKSKRNKVYDMDGRFLGTSMRNLKRGQIYIVRYDAGYSEKIMIQ